jgi:hypothetical protein
VWAAARCSGGGGGTVLSVVRIQQWCECSSGNAAVVRGVNAAGAACAVRKHKQSYRQHGDPDHAKRI